MLTRIVLAAALLGLAAVAWGGTGPEEVVLSDFASAGGVRGCDPGEVCACQNPLDPNKD